MTTSDRMDLGKATSSLRGHVVAGSYQTCVLTYTAGFAGIDDSGSIKIVMREVSDAGVPQFDDPAAPNYATASASNKSRSSAFTPCETSPTLLNSFPEYTKPATR